VNVIFSVFVTEHISCSVDVFLIKTYINNTCADPSSNTTSHTSIQNDNFVRRLYIYLIFNFSDLIIILILGYL